MQRKETRHAGLYWWLSATGRLYDSQCRKLFGSPSRRIPFLFLMKIPSSCSRAIIILTLFTLVYVILSRCWHFFLKNNSATVSWGITSLLTINPSPTSKRLSAATATQSPVLWRHQGTSCVVFVSTTRPYDFTSTTLTSKNVRGCYWYHFLTLAQLKIESMLN